MSKTDDMLTDAMARTDAEIFADAIGGEEAEGNGDHSLEAMGEGLEGQTDDESGEAEEPTEGETEGEEAGEVEAEGEKPEAKAPEEPPEEKGLPPAARAALKDERTKRQAAEAALETLRAESRAEIQAINSRLDRALAAIEKPAKAEEPKAEQPDPVLDPEGYRRHVLAEADQRYTVRRVEETFAEAHEAHGKDFEAAYAELQKLNPANPADKALGNRIYTSPNPGKALMKWHRDQVALKEIGGDPAKYRERLRDEILNDPDMVKAVLAKQREQAERPGAPRNVTRLPPSLNRARGGGGAKESLTAADNTDAAIFEHAMSS